MSNAKLYLQCYVDAVTDAHGKAIAQRMCPEQLVLAHGRLFNYQTDTVPAGFTYRTMGRCFYNSWMLAFHHPEFIYCEGISLFLGCPLAHAWCIGREHGNVVDPTWEGTDREATEYFGVCLKTEFVTKVIMTTEVTGIFATANNRKLSKLQREWCESGLPEDAFEINFKQESELCESSH